ncbi:hypothetical protein C8R46DRAFT_162259 [Mycena filopes]|nr:hypothetical protein C8R46DRAFT_162259 [Mycena filopes]
MLFTATVAILLSSSALAQYGGGNPGPATTSTTPTAAAVPSAPADTPGHVNVVAVPPLSFPLLTYKQVNVAPGSFTFSPNNFNATNGTAVTFWFPRWIRFGTDKLGPIHHHHYRRHEAHLVPLQIPHALRSRHGRSNQRPSDGQYFRRVHGRGR